MAVYTFINTDYKMLNTTAGVKKTARLADGVTSITPSYNTSVNNIIANDFRLLGATIIGAYSVGVEYTVWTLTNGNTIRLYKQSDSAFEFRFYEGNTQKAFLSHVSTSTFVGGNVFFVAFWRTPTNPQICATVCYYNNYVQKQYWSVESCTYDTASNYDFKDFFGTSGITSDDPYATNNDQNEPGGYGPFDYTSEVETPPGVPSVSAADVGFVSLWNPTKAELKSLADWLWTGSFAINTWRAIFSKPMECILSVGIVPIVPDREQSGGIDTKKEIEFTGTGTGVNSYKVTKQYYVEDMGTMHIGGRSKSSMDYSPYAKASIFLPYCGTYALDVDEIMDADISLEYHIDIYTGACVAYLVIDNRKNSDGNTVNAVMYQFTGNMLATIPVTSVDHSQFMQSLLIMGASVAATVATSGAGAGSAIEGLSAEGDVVAGAGALNAVTAGSAINTVMSMKPNVLHSGNLSSTAGFLGGQKPYITMTWSNLCRPDTESELAGMPLQKSGTLSDFKGFTIVSACHMDNILCTDAERSMIEQALGRGVII